MCVTIIFIYQYDLGDINDNDIKHQDREQLKNELDKLMKDNENLKIEFQVHKNIDMPINQGICHICQP